MKYTIKNIQSFIRNEKMIFILVLICIITSSFIINFSYGLYQNYNVIKEEEASEFTEIPIIINDQNAITKAKIKECVFSISNTTNNAISLYCAFPIIEPFYTLQNDETHPCNRVIVNFTAENGCIKPSTRFAENMKQNGNLITGKYFSEEQEADGERVALVRLIENRSDLGITKLITTRVEGDAETIEIQGEEYEVDKRWVEIQGKEYEVIGYHTQLATPYFPFESLDESTLFQDMIGIVFKNSITLLEYNEIRQNFEYVFGDAITVPDMDIPESENYYLYNTIIIISILIAILAAINFAVLYKYILSKRTKALAIFRMCGCTKTRILTIFLSECMIITVPIFVLTVFVYDKFVLPKLGQHFEYMESAYSFKLYLLIFFIYILATVVVLLFMISGFLGKTIREAKGEK